MRRIAQRLLGLLALTLALAAPGQAQVAPAVEPGGDIPAKFRPVVVDRVPPQGEVPPQFRPSPRLLQYVRRETMVPMRDGVRLYTVLIEPKNARSAPILLDRTPYSADVATARGSYGVAPETILPLAYAELVRAGYIVAVQDVRGKFRSQGDYVMNRPLRGPLNPSAVDHSTDAYDTIDWLVKNVPETNGRVATIGTSYDGFTTLMSLVRPHPALKASVPINPMVDVWRGDDWFHNGAFRQEMLSYVYKQTATRASNRQLVTAPAELDPTYLRYVSAGAYARSMGMEQLPFWRRLTQHPAYDDYWREQALDRILARQALTVPTLIVGSLWDQEDIYGAPAVFQAVKRSGQAHLVLGPWYHGQAIGYGSTLGPIDWGSDTARWFRANILMPFLDQHLKLGPAADIAPVVAFEAGANRWQRLPDWPPACRSGCPSNLTALHLGAAGRLSFSLPAVRSSDTYISDPAHPVTYREPAKIIPWAPGAGWLADDQRFAAARPDVLSYTSDPLTRPLKLAGTPLAHLVAATSGTDSDWIVKLIDVYPNPNPARPALAGYQFGIAMEVLRARYRNDPARPEPVPVNQPVTYEFALPAVDCVVQPGHRLMVQIQSSWFPLYDRNPQTFVPNIFFARAKDYRPAMQRVFTGPDGSWVGLPVVN